MTAASGGGAAVVFVFPQWKGTMTAPRYGRYPQLEPVFAELLRAKRIWLACCFSPFVYFIAARAVASWFFAERPQPGLLDVSNEWRAILPNVFLLYAVALQGALVGLRRFFNRRASKNAGDLRRVAAIYMTRTLVLLALSECAVLGGFLFFLALGDMKAVFVGGVISFIFYAQSYPSEEGLARLAGITR